MPWFGTAQSQTVALIQFSSIFSEAQCQYLISIYISRVLNERLLPLRTERVLLHSMKMPEASYLDAPGSRTIYTQQILAEFHSSFLTAVH